MNAGPGAADALRSRLHLPVVVVSLVAVAAFVWTQCQLAPNTAYLDHRASVGWIEYPLPTTMVVRSGSVPFEVVFERSFDLAGAALPGRAPLRVRGLRTFEVRVNGARVLGPTDGRDWKSVSERDVADQLVPGRNRIAVAVRNAEGPAALWLALDAGDQSIASDAEWTAAALGSPPQRARIAGRAAAYRETTHRVSGEAGGPPRSLRFDLAQRLEQPRPLDALAKRAVFVGLLFLLGGALGWWFADEDGHATPSRWQSAFPIGVVASLALWVGMVLHNLGWIPADSGFDAADHLDYIAFIAQQGRLPLYVDGGQMFQPPLFHASAAGLLWLLGLEPRSAGALFALRGFTLVAGLAQIGLIALALRRLFPGQHRAQCFGLALAALLPVHLYMFQFITNEGLAGTLATLALTLALGMLQSERVTSWRVFALGLCLGMAVLTKLTALPIAAAVVAVMGIALVERGTAPRVGVAQLGMLCATAVATCGWYFAWVWLRTGRVVLGGWDPVVASGAWWQDPGYRSAGWFARFGEALVRPLGSGLESFADGLYSTLWGDGLLSGAGIPAGGAPWDADGVAAGHLLALAPSAAIALGLVLALLHWWRERSPVWLLVFATAAASFVAVVQVSLAVPVLATTKVFYALGAMLCLCAWGAWGFDALASRGRLASGFAVALVFAWGGNAYQSHWVATDSARTLGLMASHIGPEPLRATLVNLAERRPRDVAMQRELGILHLGLGELKPALARFEQALRFDSADASAQLGAAIALDALGRGAEAEALLEARFARGRVQAADELILFGQLLDRRAATGDALAMFCAAVGVDPLSPAAHRELAGALRRRGQGTAARKHDRLAIRLDRGEPISDASPAQGSVSAIFAAERAACAAFGS